MYDIFFLGDDENQWNDIRKKYPNSQRLEKNININDLQNKSFTSSFWIVYDDVILNNFNLNSYRVTQWDKQYTHVFKNGKYFDGVCLINKKSNISNKEFSNRFFINKKEIDVLVSDPVSFEIYKLNCYDDYLQAVKSSKTEMFWGIWPDVNLRPDFKFEDYYVPYYDSFHRNITHIFLNGEHKDGICLFSKQTTVTKREFDHRFFINKKEVDIVASDPIKYDVFEIDTYDDYLEALGKSKTEMFWIVPKEVEKNPEFNFDLYFSHHNSYDRNMNHVFQNVFRNSLEYTGISLMSKNKKVTSKEINYRFFIKKKQYEIVASKMKAYDIVFISYDEPNADENYNKLLARFPRARRVHHVKGIHQAHIRAAELCKTDMFWVVDGDSLIVDNFHFDYEVSRYELNIVHVWKAKNPLNGLEYGNGGVKLLPRSLTLNMDVTKPDMTTSISKWFKAMEEVSNITAFNTDSFATWRSAFRECCKLSSRIIDRQEDKETLERLDVWCKKSNDKFALDGANDGKAYGEANKDNIEALKLINDFKWLKERFDGRYSTN